MKNFFKPTKVIWATLPVLIGLEFLFITININTSFIFKLDNFFWRNFGLDVTDCLQDSTGKIIYVGYECISTITLFGWILIVASSCILASTISIIWYKFKPPQ